MAIDFRRYYQLGFNGKTALSLKVQNFALGDIVFLLALLRSQSNLVLNLDHLKNYHPQPVWGNDSSGGY